MGRFWHHRVSYRARLAAEADKNSLDFTSIFVVHSRVIHNPHSIKKFTYKERQKLPYAGFSVFHDEILLLTYRGNILIIIQNTIPFLTLVPIVLEHKENRDSRNTTKSLPENYVNLSMVSKVQAKFPLCLLWTVKMNIKLSEYYTTPFPTPKWISPKLP